MKDEDEQSQTDETSGSAPCYVSPADSNWACYDHGSGLYWHDTRESAEEDAKQRIRDYREEIFDGWPDDVESIVVLQAVSRARFFPKDVDYRTQDAQQFASGCQVEIVGPDGEVYYRRPMMHKDVFEALQRPGYSVRKGTD